MSKQRDASHRTRRTTGVVPPPPTAAAEAHRADYPREPRGGERKTTLAEHAVGNYRVLMNMSDELLAIAAEQELLRLDDEKIFFDAFQPPQPRKAAGKKR